MSWMKKFSLARYNAKSPLNDQPAGKGPHTHPHAKGVETTDNPEGTEKLGPKVYGEKTTTIGDWQDIDGKQQRTITTKQGYTQTGITPGKTYKEAGVDAAEAKKYWEQNPEAYKRYQESKKRQLSGEDVSQKIETRDLPKPPPSKPEPEPFKPYRLSATRHSKHQDDGRRGLKYDQIKEYTIDSPEEEKEFFEQSRAREAEFDKNYPIITEHPSSGRPEDIEDPKLAKRVQDWIDRKNKERQTTRERNRGRFVNMDTGQEYNLKTNSWMDQADPKKDSFAMNFGSPIKHLDTEGTFKNKDNKKYNSYE